VIHVGVTRNPTNSWTAQQLREATASGEGPKYFIRDNDGKFGLGFERVAKTSRIEILKTPYHLPQANAICERFLGSVRREGIVNLFPQRKHIAELKREERGESNQGLRMFGS
jgi:putative transposase